MATTITGLDSYFTNLISDLMYYEQQGLTRMKDQRDTLNVQNGAYGDTKAKLKSLKDSVGALISSGFTYELDASRSALVSNVASGYTVLSASSSKSAIPGAYDIQVTNLATDHRVRSDQQLYSNQALNLSGAILVGGAATRSQITTSLIASTVTAFGVSEIDTAQTELGQGDYLVETRNDASAGWQFRLVDQNGNAVSIKEGSDDEYTDDWQAITPGIFDTGRGLTIEFGSDTGQYQAASQGNGAAVLSYTAQGATIDITATDSLNSIASKINSASYAERNGVIATVVDRQLVLASAATGEDYLVQAEDVGSDTVLKDLGVLTSVNAFKNVLQLPKNANFTVNGLAIERSQNSSLTDVISGVTLNLAADAEGRSATLTVDKDWSSAKSAINDFINQFNEVQSYLEQKTAITKTTYDDQTSYTRGPLANDVIFSDFRSKLFSRFYNDSTNDGLYQNLREIGITLDDNLKAQISDADMLEEALNTNFDSVKSLLDAVMGNMDATLGQMTGQTGETGYLDSALTSIGTEISETTKDITDENDRLAAYQESLISQFSEMQAQLLSLTYMQQQWSSLYGS